MSGKYLIGFREKFSMFPGDIFWVFWRYLMGVLEIFDGCIGDM